MTLQVVDAAIAGWAQGLGTPIEHLVRLMLAVVCGGLIGIEREVRGRQAGFRTNVLVCVGSCLVMIVSISLATTHWPSQNTYGVQISVDPGRIAYGVMGGIGFLGAGTIIHNKGSIRGLTTAAALWCVAALGLSAGLGLYVTTMLASLIVLIALWILTYVERIVPQLKFRVVIVRVKWSVNAVPDTIAKMQSHKVRVIDTSIDRRECESGYAMLSMHVGFTDLDRYRSLERDLSQSTEIELMATRETVQ